jgi:hypothetical protein
MTMLAIQDIGDWIQGIVVLIIIAGSALSGLAKAITAKLDRAREAAKAKGEGQQEAPRTIRPVMPVARPMPPPRRPPQLFERPVAKPLPPQVRTQPRADLPPAVPPLVRTILDMVLDGAVDLEAAVPTPPRARPERPPAPQRAKPPAPPRPEVGRRAIEAREEQKAELLEKRIGHVQRHVAPATAPTSPDDGMTLFDRPTHSDLRRAIILNEILSPPLALRRPA